MKQPMSLERMVASWMADAAATTAPSEQPLIDNILAATAQQRPRPRWLALLQESPMQAQAQVVVGSPNRRLLIAAALLLLAALAAVGIGAYLLQQPTPSTSDDWPGFRGDAAHGGVVGNGPTGNPVVAWKTTVAAPIRGAVSILGDMAFAGSDDGVLTAFSAADGTKRWSFAGPAPMGGPYVTAGVVYDVDGGGVVHAFQASDGTPLWASAVTIPGATDGVVSGGLLYYASSDGLVFALDTRTGAQVWKTAVSPTPITLKFPTVADGLLVATDIHGFISGLDARTGEIRWAAQQPVEIPGTPVIDHGSVYLGGAADATTGSLVSLKASDGSQQWRIDRPLSAPAILGTTGYVTAPDGTMAAVDLGSGTALWEARFPPGQMRTPALTDQVLYGYTDGSHTLFALDRATGGLLWTFELDGSNQCCIALSKGKIFVATDAGSVYAIGGDEASIAVGPIPNEPAPTTTPPSIAPAADLTTPVDWVATSGKTPFEPWSMQSAPDGTLWVIDGTTSFDLFSRDGTYLETWGTGGSGDGQFDFARTNGDPYGRIAFAADGSFFVLDPGNHRIQAFDAKRQFLRAWGALGSDPGEFVDPVGIAVDADGNVHVLDDKRKVIETYSATGDVLRTIGAYPDPVSVNDGSNDLAIGPNGHFYLSLASPGQVVELDREGGFVRAYGKDVFGGQAGSIAFDPAGHVYATQALSAPSILVFDANGSYLGGFAHAGAEDGDIGFPAGLVIDATGIYATDISGLPDFGLRSALRKFAPIQFEAAPAPALTAPKLAWITDHGPSDFIPWSMAKAPDGRLWVALALTDQFAIFDADGTYIESWGTPGTAEGQFNLRRANGDPFGMIAFNADGSFYVLDSGNHRVQAFDKDRRFIRAWGTLGKGTGQFTETGGIVVDQDGSVVVIDNVRAVIETYKSDGTVLSTMPAFPDELHAATGVNRGANEIHIGPNGHYFLSLTEPNILAEIDRDGKLVRTYGDQAPCEVTDQPNGVAWDAAGRLYLAQGPGRGDAPGILVFAPDGSCLGGFGKLGTGDSDLGFPWTILVDESGIYVTDAGGVPDFGLRSAIRKFEPLAP